jgi:hypothetical protein
LPHRVNVSDRFNNAGCCRDNNLLNRIEDLWRAFLCKVIHAFQVAKFLHFYSWLPNKRLLQTTPDAHWSLLSTFLDQKRLCSIYLYCSCFHSWWVKSRYKCVCNRTVLIPSIWTISAKLWWNIRKIFIRFRNWGSVRNMYQFKGVSWQRPVDRAHSFSGLGIIKIPKISLLNTGLIFRTTSIFWLSALNNLCLIVVYSEDFWVVRTSRCIPLSGLNCFPKDILDRVFTAADTKRSVSKNSFWHFTLIYNGLTF